MTLQKSTALTLIAVALWIPAYLVPKHLRDVRRNPPVGVYIAITGLVAAAVALRKEPPRTEKATWIVLLTLLTYAEITNLYAADADQLAKFQSISSGLAQLTLLDAKLSDLQRKMEAARGDPALLASLEAEAHVTREQIDALLRQAQPEKRFPPSLSSQALQNPALADAKEPLITSAPPIFHNGQIIGKNFGEKQGAVFLHFRVRDAAQQGVYADGGLFGPDRLLGGLDPTNNIRLSPDQIASWSDTTIGLRLSKDFWDRELNQMRSFVGGYRYEPPARSDIEVGYKVEPYPASDYWQRGFSGYFYSH